MAVVSSFIYDGCKAGIGTVLTISAQSLNTCFWSSTAAAASFYWTLVSNNYTPAENHVYASAFSGAELSNTTSFPAGYTTGGVSIRKAVASRLVNVNTTSHQAEFQADSATWSAITAGTAYAFVIIQQAGSDGLSPIITYNSLAGFPITTNGTNLTLAPTSAGIFAGVDFAT